MDEAFFVYQVTLLTDKFLTMVLAVILFSFVESCKTSFHCS